MEAVETLELQETEQFSCDLPASSGGHAAPPLTIQWPSVPPVVFLLFNTYQIIKHICVTLLAKFYNFAFEKF